MTSLVSFISKYIEKYISYKLSYRKILYLFNIDIYPLLWDNFWEIFLSKLYPWGTVYPQVKLGQFYGPSYTPGGPCTPRGGNFLTPKMPPPPAGFMGGELYIGHRPPYFHLKESLYIEHKYKQQQQKELGTNSLYP